MSAYRKLSRILLILGILLVLAAACGLNSSVTQLPEFATRSPDIALSFTPAAATPTTQSSPIVISSQTPIATVAPVTSATVASTNIPTAIPLAPDDPLWLDLQSKDYRLFFSASTTGPKGYTYSAYLFTDTKLDPYRGTQSTPEICRLAVYRWDGKTNVLLRTFGAPTYFPTTERYEYPVMCQPINWDNSDALLGGMLTFTTVRLDQATHQLLGVHDYWSDINRNGLPEFAIYYQYCPNACTNEGEVSTHFYEIEDTSSIVDLAAELPGVIHPWHLIHSRNPLDFFLYDPSREGTLEFIPHVKIRSYWIYQWDGTHLVNITQTYADEYAADIEVIVTHLQENYGKSLDSLGSSSFWLSFDEILVLSNKANLPRQETLEKFLEVTDFSHWPGTDPYYKCWLEASRAYVQMDYQHRDYFSFPPFDYFGVGPPLYTEEVQKIEQSGYDVSSCRQFLNA